MAHFAELDENNVVLRVIVVENHNTQDANGVEDESIGVAFCRRLFGGRWVQTSYNRKFRKHYAGIGHIYYPDLDAFVAPEPNDGTTWILNREEAVWERPVRMPEDSKSYIWNEATQSWDEAPPEEQMQPPKTQV